MALETVRVQLRRKGEEHTAVQVKYRLRLPGIEEPAPFYFGYICVGSLLPGASPGCLRRIDRQTIAEAWEAWRAIFCAAWEIVYAEHEGRVRVDFAYTKDGGRRQQVLGRLKPSWEQRRPELERRVRDRLREAAEAVIDWDHIEAAALRLVRKEAAE